jgi:hypothetical protein
MYRIELSPGEETVFRSIEELAVAIKRGVVTPRARIYHSASNKWLPIQFHPHYKTAVSMPLTQAELVAGPPVKQLSTLTLKDAAEPEPPALDTPAPAAHSPAPVRKKARSDQPRAGKRNRRPSKPRRQLRIALIGALLVGGAQWVLSAPLFSHPEAPRLIAAQRHLISSPSAAMKRVSSPNSAAMVPVVSSQSNSNTAVPIDQLEDLGTGVSAPSFGGGAPGTESAAAPDSATADSIARRTLRSQP